MKKLLLTSDGLSAPKIRKEFLGLLEKEPSQNRILIIHAARFRRHFKRLRQIEKGLIKLGFTKENISYADIKHNYKSKTRNYDVIYFCGGNTFYLLDRARRTHIDRLIKNLVKKGKIYIGVSAGSIMAAKNISLAGWGSEGDKNEIKLKNLRSFGFTNVMVLPHFKKRLQKELVSFRKTVSCPVVSLKDKQAILIKNQKTLKC